MREMKITGLQANLLLFAFDNYLSQVKNGGVKLPPGYSKKEVKKLRNDLFIAHEHPEEEEVGQ